jgi:hypothetical protein
MTVLPRNAYAGEMDRQKLVLELFKVMQYDRVLDQVAQTFGQQISAAVKKKVPDIKQDALDMINEESRAAFNKLNPGMMLFVGDFMTRHYTDNDLVEITRFYKTEVGQKSLAVMPKLMQEMTGWIGPATQKLMGDLTGRIKKRLDEMGYKI